jgi:hypothetical protein
MTLIARWTFAGRGGPWDETEAWQSVEFPGAANTAKLTHRGLELKKDGWACVRPAPGKMFTIKDKTLIAWLILNDLSDKQPAGSALTLDSIKQDMFDGIVFGEQAPATWMAGSNRRARWAEKSEQSLAETEPGKLIKMAITYKDAGSGGVKIEVYKNDDLKQSYTKGELATWANTDDIEVIFGARHTNLSDADVRGYLNATIVAAEIHDECLSAAAIKLRQYTDPSTFVRRTISLLTRAGASGYVTEHGAQGGLQNQAQPATGDREGNLKATWTLMPGLADPTLVSVQGNYWAREYIVASTQSTIAVKGPDGTNAFRNTATFKKLPGLAGQGWSFESLAYPGSYLRENAGGAIDLAPSDGSDTFKRYASFLEKEAPISGADITTELPLDDESWYIISNHSAAPAKVLGIGSDGVAGLAALPESGSIDHVLWRLEPLPPELDPYAANGLHRWMLFNKKAGAYLYADSAKKLGTRPVVTAKTKGYLHEHTWAIRPISWMGSDYFAITNDEIEQTLGCDNALPSLEPLNLASPQQRWRFTFMSYRDGVERPSSPERIKAVLSEVSHTDYVKTYPKYQGALGMDYVATNSVSDWALAMARTVLTNVLLTLKDRSLIDKFKGYRILIVGDGDGDEAANYPDIGFTQFIEWRGGTNDFVARISEEMMCRTGITHVPADTDYRKYDQAVHEFGHSIHRKLDLTEELKRVQGDGYDRENFPWWLQSWFDCAIAWGAGGTRTGFRSSAATQATFMLTLFSGNREWRPYEVKYEHGSLASAVISAQDKAETALTGYDQDGN